MTDWSWTLFSDACCSSYEKGCVSIEIELHTVLRPRLLVKCVWWWKRGIFMNVAFCSHSWNACAAYNYILGEWMGATRENCSSSPPHLTPSHPRMEQCRCWIRHFSLREVHCHATSGFFFLSVFSTASAVPWISKTGLWKWCSACCVWGGCHAFVVGVMPLLWVSWHYGVCHALWCMSCVCGGFKFMVCVMPFRFMVCVMPFKFMVCMMPMIIMVRARPLWWVPCLYGVCVCRCCGCHAVVVGLVPLWTMSSCLLQCVNMRQHCCKNRNSGFRRWMRRWRCSLLSMAWRVPPEALITTPPTMAATVVRRVAAGTARWAGFASTATSSRLDSLHSFKIQTQKGSNECLFNMANNLPSTEQAVKTQPKQDQSFLFIFHRFDRLSVV